MVDGGFEQECVVDSDIPDAVVFVPAWLSSASEGLVHNVIGNEEEGLEL
jgi:hypothetical protein